jgi:hypothetical protein
MTSYLHLLFTPNPAQNDWWWRKKEEDKNKLATAMKFVRGTMIDDV